MKTFNLPDPGEGLHEAEIIDWLVKEGQTIGVDEPLVSVETDKAVVEIPSPIAGKISKIYAKAGETVKVGAPLVDFDVDEVSRPENATVVGKIDSSDERLDESDVIIGAPTQSQHNAPKATPFVRKLANEKGISLHDITPTGIDGQITREDIECAANDGKKTTDTSQFKPLKGVRRSMAKNMIKANKVTQVSVYDKANIHHLNAKEDITTRVIQAIAAACQKVPILNAWFDEDKMALFTHKEINLGLAIHSVHGLFVPVINAVNKLDTTQIRTNIDHLKESVNERSLAPEAFQGATISLSNFGVFGVGEYASVVVVPPMVAIVGCGKIMDTPVVENGNMVMQRMLPLSLSFDHRAVAGQEASQFLKIIIDTLAQKAS